MRKLHEILFLFLVCLSAPQAHAMGEFNCVSEISFEEISGLSKPDLNDYISRLEYRDGQIQRDILDLKQKLVESDSVTLTLRQLTRYCQSIRIRERILEAKQQYIALIAAPINRRYDGEVKSVIGTLAAVIGVKANGTEVVAYGTEFPESGLEQGQMVTFELTTVTTDGAEEKQAVNIGTKDAERILGEWRIVRWIDSSGSTNEGELIVSERIRGDRFFGVLNVRAFGKDPEIRIGESEQEMIIEVNKDAVRMQGTVIKSVKTGWTADSFDLEWTSDVMKGRVEDTAGRTSEIEFEKLP